MPPEGYKPLDEIPPIGMQDITSVVASNNSLAMRVYRLEKEVARKENDIKRLTNALHNIELTSSAVHARVIARNALRDVE